MPAGPSGVHGPGSARALPRVVGGRRRAKRPEKGMGEVGTGMGGMGKGDWSEGWGRGWEGWGRGRGRGVKDDGPRSESSRPPLPPRSHHYQSPTSPPPRARARKPPLLERVVCPGPTPHAHAIPHHTISPSPRPPTTSPARARLCPGVPLTAPLPALRSNP